MPHRRFGRSRRAGATRLPVTVWTRVKQLLLFCYGLCIRVRVSGEGRIAVPLRRSFIVVANHVNGADSLVLQAALHTRLFFATSVRWFRSRLWRFIMENLCDAIPVETGDPVASLGGIRRCLAALESGGSVGVYPEGRFNEGGAITEVEDGAAYLSARSGAPLLPVCIRHLRYENEVDTSTAGREGWTGFMTVAGQLFNTGIEVALGNPIEPDVACAAGPAGLRQEIIRLNARMVEEFAELVEGRCRATLRRAHSA